jgi:hypothetical protein
MLFQQHNLPTVPGEGKAIDAPSSGEIENLFDIALFVATGLYQGLSRLPGANG